MKLWIIAPSTLSVVKYVNNIKIMWNAHVMKAGSSVKMEKIALVLVSWNSVDFHTSRHSLDINLVWVSWFVCFHLIFNLNIGFACAGSSSSAFRHYWTLDISSHISVCISRTFPNFQDICFDFFGPLSWVTQTMKSMYGCTVPGVISLLLVISCLSIKGSVCWLLFSSGVTQTYC